MIFNAWKSLSDGLSLCSANRVVVQSHHPGPDCLRELESLALWLKEPTRQNTLILKVSSLRYFYAKHRDFLPGNFCTLCRILQLRVPIASLETVQKQCRNRALTLGQIKKWWFLIHDLVAIWVTTKVYLIYRKMNAHSSEEFSGEWAFLYNGILYMSLATFSMEVSIFWDEVDSFSIKVAVWGKKFLLFYMASFRTFRITFHTFRTTPWCCLRSLAAAFLHKAWPWQRKRHSDG